MTGRLLDPKARKGRDEIIVQKYYEGWPAKRIAGYIGISEVAVWSRVQMLGLRRNKKEKENA